MKVIKIGVTLSRSVKVAEYQYYKPEIYIEAEVTNAEAKNISKAREDLYELANYEMQQLINDELQIRTQEEEIAELKNVLRTNSNSSRVYKLAYNRLVDLGVLEA